MKKCSKCHFQNTADSVFCANCGAKLVPVKKNSHATHHYWLWGLAIILIAFIIFEIGGHSTNSSRPHHPLSAQQFNAKTADRKMQTAAILYYAGENNVQHWPKPSGYEGNKKVTLSKASRDYQ
ncbi:zinc-ribbon domain-containing protein [Limosilactobacillus coleohominis]|uniref:zinc-ribbon domain-containing protein n=1 Tax=Limosilactobacillus coleohominis TaxID=181675 RepID=UPI00058DFBE5|nr:zinc ribbon domain-containing protein [Limosilactobacillus coleohominis]